MVNITANNLSESDVEENFNPPETLWIQILDPEI